MHTNMGPAHTFSWPSVDKLYGYEAQVAVLVNRAVFCFVVIADRARRFEGTDRLCLYALRVRK
jgi:hypothetical protein